MNEQLDSPNAQWVWNLPDWPRFVWDVAALLPALLQARRLQGQLLGLARVLEGGEAGTRAQSELLLQDALTTSAIEGEKLNPEGVRSSIARHLGLPTAGLARPSRHEDGLISVLLEAVRLQQAALTPERLRAWHAALFPQRGILHDVRPGQLRGAAPMRIVSGPVAREQVHYLAPPREQLEAGLQAFCDWFNTPPPELDGLLRAGLAHLWFELLHPFEDGNGRLGRAIADCALAQDEGRPARLMSLSARFLVERKAYYAQLEACGRSLEVTHWLRWFLQQVSAASEAAQQAIEGTLAKAHFWLHHAETPLNQRQRKALNHLLDAGPEGFAGGMTTRKYASLCDIGRVTASQELAAMVELGCLRALGGRGRSAAYEIAHPKV